jgi:hemolysin III
MGVGVEFIFPTWQGKGRFSLAMYLGMGWSALVCLPEVARTLDQNAINLMTLGGVAYTAGVPFFVRDNSMLVVVCECVCVCMLLVDKSRESLTPKFVLLSSLSRSLDLDHAIWHMFVLAGSLFHWCGIYFYVTPFPISASSS